MQRFAFDRLASTTFAAVRYFAAVIELTWFVAPPSRNGSTMAGRLISITPERCIRGNPHSAAQPVKLAQRLRAGEDRVVCD
jgi:hypothetical protein